LNAAGGRRTCRSNKCDQTPNQTLQQTKATLQTDDVKVLADRGYFSGEEIMKCEQAGVTPLVPKPLTNNAATIGRFEKRDFHYDPKRDRYICPAGEHAIWRFTSIQKGMEIRKYRSSACPKRNPQRLHDE
jgi:hypothetical protein